MLLFGSRARGDAWPSSDWDIAVVLEGVDDPLGEAAKLYGLKRGFPADIIVIPLDEAARYLAALGCVEVLYDGLGVAGLARRCRGD